MDQDQQGGAGRGDPEGRADYRFLLANERTFLAYVRTALALQVAGLGALQFLTQAHSAVRLALGLALVAIGSVTALTGSVRARRNERAIRAGEDLRPGVTGALVAGVVMAVPLVAALALALN